MSKKLIFYYSVLTLILISWNNPDALPALPLRLGYLVLAVLPLFFKAREYFFVVVFYLVILSGSGHAISYMPTTGPYLLMIFLAGILFFRPAATVPLKLPWSFIPLTVLTLTIDIGSSNEIYVSYAFLIIILLSLGFVLRDSSDQLEAMKLSFIVLSLVLSIEYLIWGSQFLTEITVGNVDYERYGWADPNYFSCILGFGLLIAYSGIVMPSSPKDRGRRIFYWLVLLLSLYVIMTIASRGATVAVFLSLIVMTLFSSIHTYKKVMFIVAFSGMLLLFYHFGYIQLLYDRFQSDDGTAGNRLVIWAAKLKAFADADVWHHLFGFGMKEGRQLGFTKIQGFHNEFLAFLVCYGIVGLILFVVMLFSPLFGIKRGGNKYILPYLVYLIAVCISLEPFSSQSIIYMSFFLYVLLLGKEYKDERISN